MNTPDNNQDKDVVSPLSSEVLQEFEKTFTEAHVDLQVPVEDADVILEDTPDGDDDGTTPESYSNSGKFRESALFRRQTNPYLPKMGVDGSPKITVRSERKAPHDIDPDTKVPEGEIFDWFSDMRRNNWFAYDKDLHKALSEIMKHTFERQTAVQMVVNEFGESITQLALSVDFDYKRVLNDALTLLSIDTLRQLINSFGLASYSEEIIIRAIESNYGQSPKINKLEATKKLVEREMEEDKLHALRKINKGIADLLQAQNKLVTKPEKHSVFLKPFGKPHTSKQSQTDPMDSTDS